MPCYNAEHFLKKAIESILNQTFTDFEFIIIDDCSSDRSASIIHEYIKDDPRIRYIKNEKNLGVAASLNRGIDLARGQFIARMDADDISLPERLERQVNHMKENPSCVACGTDIILIDEKGHRIGTREYYHSNKNIKKNIHRASCFAHPTVMMRRKTIIENNLFYSTRLRWVEDYDLWFRLSQLGEFKNIANFLLLYRISSTSIKNNHCKETLRNTIKLKMQYLARGCFRSYIVLIFEIVLLAFPKKVILFFYKLYYSKSFLSYDQNSYEVK